LVGIVTNAPQEKLHVAGKVRVDKELTVGEKATVDKLRVEKDMSVGAKVTVDSLRVEKDVSVGSAGAFYIDAADDPGGRLLIDTAGKVSIKKLRVEKDVSVGGE